MMPHQILRELGALLRSRPALTAPPVTVAAWYERKAELFEHIAADGGPDATNASRQAELAHEHARSLARGAAA